MRQDLHKISDREQAEELQTELDNASKQLEKGKDIKSRLTTIGGIVKDIGIKVFASLAASQIKDSLIPLLGL
ncbi:hypothetical protein B0A56_12860 [Flavobacterium columnare NBRC 100251 = ATCC 23463]|nr:hypothetical protein B0A56_12860 [Flavobacterium columnare NBRC 100251 = ATCC 23463]